MIARRTLLFAVLSVLLGGLAAGCVNLSYTSPLSGSIKWLAAWDANGDGKLDLVMSHPSGANLDFLEGGAHGMYARTVTPSALAGIKIVGLAVGAFGPGKKDQLAVLDTNNPAHQRVVFYSRLGPGATPVSQVALDDAGAVALAAGDVNGDGYDDLAISSRRSNFGFGCITNGCILFVLGGANGPTLSPLSVSAGPVEDKRYDPAQPSLVDLNGDGKLDLVVPNQSAREIVFIPAEGDGVFDQDNDLVLAATPEPPIATRFGGTSTAQNMLVAFLPGSGVAARSYSRPGKTGPFAPGRSFDSVNSAAGNIFTTLIGAKLFGRADVAESINGGCAMIGDLKTTSVAQVCNGSLLFQTAGLADVADAPDQIDFGNVQVGETKTLTVGYRLVTNNVWSRDHSVGVSGPAAGPFDMVGLRSEFGLKPYLADENTIVVQFAPRAAGPFQSVITLQTQGTADAGGPRPPGFVGGPVSIALRGVGVGSAPGVGSHQTGFAEEASKFADDGGVAVYKELATLGAKVNRWTLAWEPTNPEREFAFLDRSVPAAQQAGVEPILSVFPAKASNTGDPAGFCNWLQGVATRYPSLHRFIIGNEVNATRFWSPQHTATNANAGPQSYYATLTRCYDALKSVNQSIQVIGMGLAPRSVDANSTKPLAFIRALGAIYRKDSARGATPIMDAVAVHPYPNPNVNPPPAPDNAKYEDADFYGIPQLDRVKQAVWEAFSGTAQKTTLDGLPIVIDEIGYQSDTSGKAAYTGTENSPVVSESNQATYYARVVGLYACDPSVSDVLLFHLVDESQRNADSNAGGWQSGLEYPDGTHKPSFTSVHDAIANDCKGATVTWKPGGVTGAGTTGSTDPPLGLTTSRALSSLPLVQSADGSLTWEAEASAPSALTVTWAVRRDRSSTRVAVKGTKTLAFGAPIALSIDNDLDPGHYLGTVTLGAAGGGGASFNLDFVVAGTFSSKPKRSPLVGVRAGDGSLRWAFAETVPEAARVTPTVYRGNKLVLKGNVSTLRDGDPVVLPLADGLEPGTYSVRFLVRSAAKGSRGVDYVTGSFTVISPAKPSATWRRNAQGAAFWSSGTVAPKGGATLKVSWGSGSSVTKLQAGDPVSFFVDTTSLKKGGYTLRVTIAAPGGTAQSIGAALNLRVS